MASKNLRIIRKNLTELSTLVITASSTASAATTVANLKKDSKSQVYEAGTHTNIICSNCGAQTSWDLDAPAPLMTILAK